MKAIVATDKIWGIGKNNKLLFHIKEDMEFFKKITTGKVVVMGRKTLESLPNGKFLKDRINLVISSKQSYKCGSNIIGAIDKINNEIKKYNSDDVIIIGGASIYSQFIDKCDTIYITTVDQEYNADAYMENPAFENFVLSEKIKCGQYKDGKYYINKWVLNKEGEYKSVLWFNDIYNNTLFLYSDDLLTWKEIYNNNYYIFTDLLSTILSRNFTDKINIKQIDTNIYRAEISNFQQNTPKGFRPFIGSLRLAAFGNTEEIAKDNINIALMNIIKSI